MKDKIVGYCLIAPIPLAAFFAIVCSKGWREALSLVGIIIGVLLLFVCLGTGLNKLGINSPYDDP